jgi:hypothetical protein
MASISVDVLAVERGDEGAVEPIDDAAGASVALVLDFLDGVHLRRIGGVAHQHLFQKPRALVDLTR